MRCLVRLAAAGIVAAGSLVGVASAGPIYGFLGVSDPSDVNEREIGEAQMTVEVIDAGSNQVTFTFRNTGLDPATIARVYFDDGSPDLFSGIAAIASIAGVSFSQSFPGPGNLPAPAGLGFSSSHQAGAVQPPPDNGVNPGEWLSITLGLAGTNSYANTLSAIGAGSLRMGLHVISIGATGGSESFINDDEPNEEIPGEVPEPATLALLALGGIGLAGGSYRRRRQTA